MKQTPTAGVGVCYGAKCDDRITHPTPPVRRMLCLARPGAQSSPLPEWVKVTVNGTPEDIDKGPFGRQAPHDKENHTSARVVGESWN